MIKLEIADYCQDCLSFEADVKRPERLYICDEIGTILGDTIVRCEHRRRCEALKRYLEQQIKKGEHE